MNRRKFLRSAGVGVAATTAVVAAPAVVRAQPTFKWRCTSSFPKSLDTIYGAAVTLSERVLAATDGNFEITIFASGEIVPGLQALDAVQSATVEMCHTAPYYYVGKDPTFAFGTAVPFGLNCRQQNAWLYQGGGHQLMNDFYKSYNVIGWAAGNTGAQMGGWYRKEINSVADLNGLKMRIGGWGGRVLSGLGVVPQQIAGGDIYPSLEKGTIDAAEWVGPYDDEKLGFQKVAENYYYPGWWEGGPTLMALMNIAAWESLPKTYQSILQDACYVANTEMMAKYDALNPAALKRLVAGGAKLHVFPKEVMQAAHTEAFRLYDEESAKNPNFKTVYDSWKPFRTEQLDWFKVAELNYDFFNLSAG